MVDVDVGVVTYNSRDTTVAALHHLLADASDGISVRLLVRDNASSDGTAEAIAAAFPAAEVEAGDENLGFGAGMNRNLARSTAPWFFALNSDAWPEPGALATLVAAADAHPRAAVVAPRLERPDGTLEHSTHPFPSVRVAAVCAVGGYRRLFPRLSRRWLLNGAWDHDVAQRVDWAVGAALLMRRDAVADVGGFDERFFMYAEELDWCWRAHRRGWEIWFEPAAVVRHIGGASAEPAYGRRRTRAYLHNSYRFYRRNHSALNTTAYRALSVVGCARLYVVARLRNDDWGRALWADHVRAHLARVGPTDTGPN